MSDAGKLIVEITRNVERDSSPLQLVSADVLAYYRRCEAELEALRNSAVDDEKSPSTNKKRSG